MGRRTVSNSEFESAWSDRKNLGTINGVLKKYKNCIDKDDLLSCGMRALWKALSYYDKSFGQKFTTSLYRFVTWECNSMYEKTMKLKKEIKKAKSAFLTIDYDSEINYDDLIKLIECDETRTMVDMYYKGGKTLKQIASQFGYASESVRQRIKTELNRLRGKINV